MKTTALVPALAGPVEDTALVALNPGDLAATQKGLVAWCERKIVSLQQEVQEFGGTAAW
jgi:hypothetical protein